MDVLERGLVYKPIPASLLYKHYYADAHIGNLSVMLLSPASEQLVLNISQLMQLQNSLLYNLVSS